MMKVLGVGAHPDDIEIFCGGTMAKYAERGDELTVAYVTDGQMGHPTLPPQEISAIRREEARAACDILGAEMIWLGFQDEFFFYNEESRIAFIDMIRRVGPDVIITHYPDFFSGDHTGVGQQANDAAIVVNMPNLKTQHPPVEIPQVYFMDAPAGVGFVPDQYVDITDTFELKKKLVSCHKSQSEWLEWGYGVDYIELIEIVARFRGLQAGVRYAEGFKRVKRAFMGNITGDLLP
ncbi:MAG: PIG-L family deacetylase [Candidatus Brocadiae bacterium]|nr:PIG-L family deacetylase [Candidatus Brocadiia bacterium]